MPAAWHCRPTSSALAAARGAATAAKQDEHRLALGYPFPIRLTLRIHRVVRIQLLHQRAVSAIALSGITPVSAGVGPGALQLRRADDPRSSPQTVSEQWDVSAICWRGTRA